MLFLVTLGLKQNAWQSRCGSWACENGSWGRCSGWWTQTRWMRMARTGLGTEVNCPCVFSGQGGTMTQVTPVETASWGIFSEQLPPLFLYSLLKPPLIAGAPSWLRSALGFESGTLEAVLQAGPAVRLLTPRQVFPVGAGGARQSWRCLGARDVKDRIRTLLPASFCSPGLSPVTEATWGHSAELIASVFLVQRRIGEEPNPPKPALELTNLQPQRGAMRKVPCPSTPYSHPSPRNQILPLMTLTEKREPSMD